MISVEEGKDRGQALFEKYESAVTQFVAGRKGEWFNSVPYKGLKSNCRQMDLYVDNNAAPASTFISDITPQTIRRAYNEYSALFNKFFEQDPLFSVRRGSGIPPEVERAIIDTLTQNLEKTYFRERCFPWTIDHIVRYGTAATYSFAVDDYNANSLMTVKDGCYEGTYNQVAAPGEPAVVSTPIHPLNVIFDPRANFMVSPDYIGFMADISVANIATLLDNDIYVAKNLKDVYERCKAGMPDKYWFDGNQGPSQGVKNYSKNHATICYLWTRLPFEGNEDDPTRYAVEMIADKIIRIEANPLDGDTVPLAIMRILPRQYTWYGNSPLVDKVCVYNLQYWLLNTTVESTARLMDRIVLYRDGSLDVTAINSRHQTGGLVPYRGQEQDLSKLIYSQPMTNPSYRENDWLMQLARREDQDSSAMPNFNPQSEGGPTNKTLGGAQMMASIGEIKMNRMVTDMSIGLKDIAKHQLVLLRNIVQGDAKAALLGDVQFSTKTANVFNYIRESIDSKNRLLDVVNLKSTEMPQAACIKSGKFIQDFVRSAIRREDIEDYCDVKALDELDNLEIQKTMQQAVPAATVSPNMPGPSIPGGVKPMMPPVPPAAMIPPPGAINA